jgi:ketosteroid isomerase-like protein
MSERERRFRDGMRAYNERGPEALLEYMTEDVVWVEDPAWPDGQTWHGHQGVRDAFRERLDSTSISAEVENVVERGELMLVEFLWTAVGLGSGAEAVLRPAVVQRYRGELICHVRFFIDRERAREAFEAG